MKIARENASFFLASANITKNRKFKLLSTGTNGVQFRLR